MSNAKNRVAALLEKMAEAGVDYYVIPTADFHNSEYVSDYFKVREYISGFTGSNGTLVINKEQSGLWTDGRYFVQAEKELQGSGIKLFRMAEEGVPTIPEYLEQNVKNGDTVAFDGRVVEAGFGKELEQRFHGKQINMKIDSDLADSVWIDRPKMPASKIWVVPENLIGKNLKDKMSEVRCMMKKEGAEQFLLTKLDDIMWLYNIRANDIDFNPVALAYTFITQKESILFVQKPAVTDELITYLQNNDVILRDYDEINEFLKDYSYTGLTLLNENSTNYLLYKILEDKSGMVDAENPTTELKAIKTETELENIRDIYIKDSAVLTKFLRWMKLNVEKEDMTEISVAQKLDHMRSELEGFLDLSFPTISAYEDNAAMVHYEPSEEHPKKIEARGLFLVDSGGQYMQGTTDVTRTIALGALTEDMKKHFSKTAAGMLRLAHTKFLYGCTGKNVDIMAREPLWECNIDYKHGTGHGIGYILNVHEGPQNVRWKYMDSQREALLEAGMIVSDEPGVYIENSHGIRIENILEIVNETKNGDGQFMGFRMLTYVPIDLDAIDSKYLEQSDIDKLNAYHAAVFEIISPFMNKEELEWLKHATRRI